MRLSDQAADMFPLLTTAGRDEKAWAKRILWREKKKDPDLIPIQVDFAKRALEVKDKKPE